VRDFFSHDRGDNNLVQWRLRWYLMQDHDSKINTFIRVLPFNYAHGQCRLQLPWLRLPCWFFCNLGLKNCGHGWDWTFNLGSITWQSSIILLPFANNRISKKSSCCFEMQYVKTTSSQKEVSSEFWIFIFRYATKFVISEKLKRWTNRLKYLFTSKDLLNYQYEIYKIIYLQKSTTYM